LDGGDRARGRRRRRRGRSTGRRGCTSLRSQSTGNMGPRTSLRGRQSAPRLKNAVAWAPAPQILFVRCR
jgi:hypothetical protein